RQMLKEQKPNSSRLYSEGADKRGTFLSNVVPIQMKELVNDDNDDEEEISKIGGQKVTESDEGDNEATESDRESEDEKTKEQEEETFDLIPRTPKDNEDDDNNEEDQGLRIGEEERMYEEKEADELYPSQLPTPPTQILSLDLQSLPTFTSVFHFEDMVKSLEDNFSNIPDGRKQVYPATDEQRNLYKALVEAYDADKTILDTYGESAIMKRRREDNDQEGPFAGSDRGSKNKEKEGSMHQLALHLNQLLGVQADLLQAAQGNAQSWISTLAKQTDARSSFNELLDTPIDFSNFIMNRLGIDTLTPEFLAGPTYELMRGSYLVPRAMWIQEPISYDKHALWGVYHWGQKRQQFYGFAVNRESALDVYSKRRIITVIELKIVEWHNYKHLDWISVRRDDDKIYKLKEGDLKRLPIQDIEDMLLLLVQGKLSNLTVDEHFAFNISLRMFTRSIVIQRRVEDLQLGVESY
nr:hypothetical protein [Tanacetum cinerariifolium]